MDELRALRRRAAGEVVPLDQGGAQAAAGGVEGHPGPGDAAADDQHVERGGGQGLERPIAVEAAVRHARRLVGDGVREPAEPEPSAVRPDVHEMGQDVP